MKQFAVVIRVNQDPTERHYVLARNADGAKHLLLNLYPRCLIFSCVQTQPF